MVCTVRCEAYCALWSTVWVATTAALGRSLEEVAAGVEVAVPLREIAARDGDAQPVAGGDAHPDRAERDVVAIDAVRLQQRRFGEALPVARPHDPLLQVDRAAVRVDLAEARRPVGVARRGRGVQGDSHVADELHWLRQRLAGVDEDAS